MPPFIAYSSQSATPKHRKWPLSEPAPGLLLNFAQGAPGAC